MKKTKRIILLTLLTLAVAMLIGISCYAANNGAGNEANGGFAVSDGSNIYYSADGNLYRANADGNNKRVLVENTVSSIALSGDDLYYFDTSVIYRVKNDGSDQEFITRAALALTPNTFIKDGYMYYRGAGSIYKYNLSSSSEKEIAGTYETFVVSGNKIYFSNDSSNAGATGLASIDLDGGSFKSYGVGTAVSINVYNGNIYYIKDFKEIWKISTNGGDATKLCSANVSYINVYKDYIYFRENGKLTRISINGGEKETSGLSVNPLICICEDKIYDRDTDGYENVDVNDMPTFNFTTTPKPTKTPTPTAKPEKTPKPTKTPSPTKAPSRKNDVSDIFIYSDWAEDEIQEAYDNGLIPEYFEENSVLNRPIWRDEFAAIAVQLYEELSGKTLKSVNTPFTDISVSDLTTEIGKAYGADIAVGISRNEFDPWTKLNREQLATMLCRVIKKYKFPEWSIDDDGDYHMSGASGKKFADDANISDFAKDSVYFMSSVGIVQGVGDNKFAPKNTTSWEEAEGYANATIEQAIVIANRIYKTRDMF